MYAVVKTGGKQYRVTKDDTILVEKLDADEGQTVTLSDVMLLGDDDKVTVGTPVVANASVEAQVISQTRGPKIIIFRRKRRKNHRRTQGHRQDLTLLKITHINTSSKKAAPAKKAAAKPEVKPAAKKEAAPAKKAAAKAESKPAAKKKAAPAKKAAAKAESKPAVKKVAAKKTVALKKGTAKKND
jgi:large subunit ribosomal protein L21